LSGLLQQQYGIVPNTFGILCGDSACWLLATELQSAWDYRAQTALVTGLTFLRALGDCEIWIASHSVAEAAGSNCHRFDVVKYYQSMPAAARWLRWGGEDAFAHTTASPYPN